MGKNTIVALLASVTLLNDGMRSIRLEEAIEDEGMRQEYLEQVFTRGNFVYLERIVYDPDKKMLGIFAREGGGPLAEEQVRENANKYLTTPAFLKKHGQGKRSPTFGGKGLFAKRIIQNEADMLESLRHEELHAKEIAHGKLLDKYEMNTLREYGVDIALITIVSEMEMYKKQKRVINRSAVSERFAKNIDEMYMLFHARLIKYVVHNAFEERIKSEALEQ